MRSLFQSPVVVAMLPTLLLVVSCSGGPELRSDERLHAAVAAGDAAAFRRLLDENPDIIEGRSIADLSTPLARAISLGRLDLATALLERGADIDSRDYRGRTPLFVAIEAHDVSAASFLVQRGAGVSVRDVDAISPVLCAAENDAAQVLGVLRRHATPADIFESIALDDLQAIEGSLERDREVISRPRHPPGDLRQPLHLAAALGRERACALLLSAGAEVAARDETRSTPLHLAAAAARLEVCETLVGEGAPIDAVNGIGFTALHLAALRGDSDLASRLLARGADPRLEDRGGRTAAEWAHRNGHRALEELLARALVLVDRRPVTTGALRP